MNAVETRRECREKSEATGIQDTATAIAASVPAQNPAQDPSGPPRAGAAPGSAATCENSHQAR